MKKLLILGIAILSLNGLVAQQDAKAKVILDKLSAKAKTFNTITASSNLRL